MQNPVADFVAALRLGEAQEHRGLTLLPLLSDFEARLPFLTLEEALLAGLVELKEVSEGGSVNELRVLNRAGSGVFILDGEELVGAKQNRIANASFLAPPGGDVVIDVSCIERGRWRYTSERFSTSDSVYASTGRRRKMEDVTGSLFASGRFQADQGRVWGTVGQYLEDSGTLSGTDSFVDFHKRFKERLDAAVAAFRALPGQVGALVAVAGRIAGLDAFGRAETWSKLAPKLVRSYAMDSLATLEDPPPVDPPATLDPPGFLARLRDAPAELFRSVGEGSDVRLRSDSVLASALVVGDEVLHLTAFPAASAA